MNAVVNPFASTQTEKGSGALAKSDQQRALAEIQGRLLIARANPRDPVAAVDRILNACTRPGLADSAVYQYARGGTDISGPSIRLAEAIGQEWSNIEFGFRELYRGMGEDGVTYSEVEAFAWDLEKNTRRAVTFRARHWRDKKGGGGYRITDERDIYELTANMAQRRVRACILAIVPGDVVEAAVNQCEITLKAKADTSPEAMQKMVAAFEPFGVTKEQIEQRIQRRLEAIQPAQVVGLKKIYASLRDGMSRPEDWFEAQEAKPQDTPKTRAEAVKERLSTRKNQSGRPATGQSAGPKEKTEAAESQPWEDEPSGQLFDPDTGEIAMSPPEPQCSATFLDWLADIETLDSIAAVAHSIRAIKEAEGLTKDEKAQLVEVLKQRQAAIKEKTQNGR